MSPSDPRAARSRSLIVAAARDLLRDTGPASVTFAAVAERSGVGRATVYRHWPSIDALLDEVLDGYHLPYFLDPKQPIEPWMHGELRRLSDELLFPAVVRMTTALMQRDTTGSDERSKRRERLFGELERRLGELLPIQPGDTDTALPAEERAALLIGPLLYLALARGAAVRDTFIDHLIADQLAP